MVAFIFWPPRGPECGGYNGESVRTANLFQPIGVWKCRELKQATVSHAILHDVREMPTHSRSPFSFPDFTGENQLNVFCKNLFRNVSHPSQVLCKDMKFNRHSKENASKIACWKINVCKKRKSEKQRFF